MGLEKFFWDPGIFGSQESGNPVLRPEKQLVALVQVSQG